MVENTPSLALPLIAAGQAQKHVTHNEALALLDALVQLAVIDRDLAVPPGHPEEGDRYLVAADPSGAWAGWAGRIARYQDGAWFSLVPRSGWLVFVADEAEIYAFTNGAWSPLRPALTALQNLTRLGLGTAADAQNPFAAKLNKALWTALTTGEGGDGDLRYTLNKQAAGHVLSLLLQTGFSGRAEIGLVGNDDLSLRVSPDGGTWITVFTVERTTGAALFDKGILREELTVFTASGAWTKPDWARTVTVTAMGGGGGGGGARRGAAGTVRNGGGGGGAGALNSETFAASEIGATLTVTIGAGGAGAPAVTTDDTNGTSGAAGGATSVHDGSGYDLVRALGGSAGGGGTNSAPGSGGAAGGGVLPRIRRRGRRGRQQWRHRRQRHRRTARRGRRRRGRGPHRGQCRRPRTERGSRLRRRKRSRIRRWQPRRGRCCGCGGPGQEMAARRGRRRGRRWSRGRGRFERRRPGRRGRPSRWRRGRGGRRRQRRRHRSRRPRRAR